MIFKDKYDIFTYIINLVGKIEGGKLQFLYDNKDIQDAIEKNCYEGIVRKIGLEMTRKLKKRLLQMKASSNFANYVNTGLGKPHPLNCDLDGYYGITITGNFRLVVKPITDAYDVKSLSKCDTVLVKGVVDYHGRKNDWILS